MPALIFPAASEDLHAYAPTVLDSALDAHLHQHTMIVRMLQGTSSPAESVALMGEELVEDNPELHPLKEALQRAKLRLEEATGIRCTKGGVQGGEGRCGQHSHSCHVLRQHQLLLLLPTSAKPLTAALCCPPCLSREALEAEAQKVAQLAVNAEGAVTKYRKQLEEASVELEAAEAANQRAMVELAELRQQMASEAALGRQGTAV